MRKTCAGCRNKSQSKNRLLLHVERLDSSPLTRVQQQAVFCSGGNVTALVHFEAAKFALEQARTIRFDELSQLPAVSGIYAIFDGQSCLYVGQSINLKKRWQNHGRKLQFKSVQQTAKLKWIEAPTELLLGLESLLIQFYCPRWNRRPLKMRHSKNQLPDCSTFDELFNAIFGDWL